MMVRLAGDVQVMSRGRPGEVQVRVKSQKYSKLNIGERGRSIRFGESNEVDVWKMTPLLTDGQMDQNQNNRQKSHFKFRIVTTICKFH